MSESKIQWAGSWRNWVVTLSKSLSLSGCQLVQVEKDWFGLGLYTAISQLLTVYGSLKWAFLLPEEDHQVHGTVSWACWQALLRAAKAHLMEGDGMWPGEWEPPTSEHLSLGDPGQFTRPWFFPFGKDREITCLRRLLWGHKNGHKAFSQIQSPGLQNALELSHEKSNQRRSRDFAGFPESSLRMSRIFITSPCFLQLSLVQKEGKKKPNAKSKQLRRYSKQYYAV